MWGSKCQSKRQKDVDATLSILGFELEKVELLWSTKLKMGITKSQLIRTMHGDLGWIFFLLLSPTLICEWKTMWQMVSNFQLLVYLHWHYMKEELTIYRSNYNPLSSLNICLWHPICIMGNCQCLVTFYHMVFDSWIFKL